MLGWLGWRRRNDGFEWHEYVRTTIKLRREERRRKLEEIRDMAADGAREAGRQGMAAGRQGLEASGYGLRRGAAALWAGLRRGVAGLWAGLARASLAVWRGLCAGGEWLRRGDWFRGSWFRVSALSMRAKISLLFSLLAALAAASALMQFQDLSAAWSAGLAGIVAVALVGLAAAPWLREIGQRAGDVRMAWPIKGTMAGLVSWKAAGTAAASVAAIALVGAGAAWLWTQPVGPETSPITTASLGRIMPPLPVVAPAASTAAPDEISGEARALSGGVIDVAGRTVRLAGIEALERGQACRDGKGRAWRCGQRAERFLRSLVQRRRVVCRALERAETGGFTGRCEAAGRDLGAAMVAEGHAFATGSFLWRTYGGEESTAQSAKRGIWQGDAERPADFRESRWAAAQKSAPAGCPIKGRVTRGGRVYVVPWAPDYARVRVRPSRGERWFCSEAEAQAAGFAPETSG